ncbi:MAG: TaqI-like C-terminal specificity domain-containing protein [Kiritimatiellia bacterium]
MKTELKIERMPEQTLLFGNSEINSISIDESAAQLRVSSATIRNWLKTGYLSSVGKGKIDLESLDNFTREHAGKQRLTSRANKSQKDTHDHSAVANRFISRIVDNLVDLQNLGTEYQTALSDSHRNTEGIYYTPEPIIIDMFRKPAEDVSSKIFCDPCCGSGNFIARALEVGFKPENIVGYDIDPVAIELTKHRIKVLSGYNSQTIHNENFLDQAIHLHGMYDYIFTNPPWGKKLSKDQKDSYASIFHAGKSNDTCSLFLFACLRALKSGGRLGLLLPEAFFNISAYEKARRVALDLMIERLIDYEKPFAGLLTRAQAIVLTATRAKNDSHQISCEFGRKINTRAIGVFKNNSKAILNLYCDSDAATIIDHAFTISHITFKGRARWGLGVVTGNNKKFVRDTSKQGYVPVFKGSDITPHGLKEPSCFIPSDFSLYQQVAPTDLYEAPEKLIYRFISSELCFFADSEQRFILNSANMSLPDNKFPISCQQLASLLNSQFINWLFRNIFNTHKILRGDLETLPLHVSYFDLHQEFRENTYLNYLGIEKEPNGSYRLKKTKMNDSNTKEKI